MAFLLAQFNTFPRDEKLLPPGPEPNGPSALDARRSPDAGAARSSQRGTRDRRRLRDRPRGPGGRPLPHLRVDAPGAADRLRARGGARARHHVGPVQRSRHERRGVRADPAPVQRGLRPAQRHEPDRRRPSDPAQLPQRSVPPASGERVPGADAADDGGPLRRRDPGRRWRGRLDRAARAHQRARDRRRDGVHRRRRRNDRAVVPWLRRVPGRLRARRAGGRARPCRQGGGPRLPRATAAGADRAARRATRCRTCCTTACPRGRPDRSRT